MFGSECVSNGCVFDHLGVFEFDSKGQACRIAKHDIIVRLPKGSLPCGEKLHLEIAVALCGPFQHSDGKRQISPIIGLYPQEPVSLLKPLEITLPHIFKLTMLTQEEVYSFGVTSAKAKHTDFNVSLHGQKQCVLKVSEDTAVKFVSNKEESDTILRACYLCLEMNTKASVPKEVAQKMATKTGYCLYCIECLEPLYPDLPQRDVVYFCVCLYLKTYQEVLL